MSTFYISDTHFNHEKIIRLANRPFENVADMNAAMVNNWNEVVTDDDNVYFLGDFAWSEHSYWFHLLNGRKFIIWGNHDQGAVDLPWADVYHYLELKDGPYNIVLFHYPIYEWNGLYKGYYHFYGHVHNDLKGYEKLGINWKARAFDVGVEALNYYPQTAEEIIMQGNR